MGKKAKKKKKKEMKKAEKQAKKVTVVAGHVQTRELDPDEIPNQEAIKAELIRIMQGKTRRFGNLRKMSNKEYEPAMAKLQIELVKLQEHIKKEGLRIVVIFEGRDTAGKGGVIKRIIQSVSPRVFRVAALGTPSDRDRTQWYFQRYVAHLPAAGEIVLFDRSWYNRAMVEKVMGFCTKSQYEEFFLSCPEFERMLIRSGIILIKYFLAVSAGEQEKRFRARTSDATKRWKLSPMDLASMDRWVDYSRAIERMSRLTHIPESPWFIVDAEVKKRARLNCISHLLSMIDYDTREPERVTIPERQIKEAFTPGDLENLPYLVPARF